MNEEDTYNKTLDLALVEALFNSGSMLMHHATLLNHAKISVSPRPAASEVSARIRVLDSKGLVLTSRGPMGSSTS